MTQEEFESILSERGSHYRGVLRSAALVSGDYEYLSYLAGCIEGVESISWPGGEMIPLSELYVFLADLSSAAGDLVLQERVRLGSGSSVELRHLQGCQVGINSVSLSLEK